MLVVCFVACFALKFFDLIIFAEISHLRYEKNNFRAAKFFKNEKLTSF